MILAIYLGRHLADGGGIGLYVRGLLDAYLDSAEKILPENVKLLIIGDNSLINERIKSSRRIVYKVLPKFKSHKIGMIFDQIFLPFYLGIKKIVLLHSLANIGIIFLKSKQIITVHDLFQAFPSSGKQSAISFLYRMIFFLQFKRVDAVICDTQAVEREIVAKYNFPKSSVITIPLGVDREFLKILKSNQQPRFSKGYVLIFSSLDPRKNTFKILQAWKNLPQDLKCRGLVVKHIGNTHNLMREVIADDLEYIKEYNWLTRAELVKLISEAEIVCVPSINEGFGFPAIEAGLLGIKVVTSKIEALNYFDIPKENLFFCNPESVQDISTAIVKAFKSKVTLKDCNSLNPRTLDDVAIETMNYNIKIIGDLCTKK